MNIVSWNIRGQNEKRKHMPLKNKPLKEQSIIMMIKCLSNLISNLAPRTWKGSQAIVINAQGVARGLALIWNPIEISMTNFFSTQRSISTRFQLVGSAESSFLTNVYGP
jgi:hypothetical protein